MPPDPVGRRALGAHPQAGLWSAHRGRRAGLPGPEATIAQRIVRAKRTLAAANVRFELPGPRERPARLDAVREVVYLVFNEGHTATTGDSWTAPELCAEALRLGRMLVTLTPGDTETLGLLALMEIQASRLPARVAADGSPVLLLDQDRSRWDQLLVRSGLAHVDQVDRLGGTVGPYALQAAIAACHARARVAADTDWERITALYDGLAQISPSPVVELNRRRRNRAGVRPGGGPRDRAAPAGASRPAQLSPAAGGRRRPAVPQRIP